MPRIEAKTQGDTINEAVNEVLRLIDLCITDTGTAALEFRDKNIMKNKSFTVNAFAIAKYAQSLQGDYHYGLSEVNQNKNDFEKLIAHVAKQFNLRPNILRKNLPLQYQ